MTHVFALTIREIAERKLLLVGSAAMGLMVLLAPLLRGTGSYTYLDVADVAALIVVTSVYLGGCVALGATVIGRDLSSGKLSFFLTRPFGAAEIWMGRMLGAFLTALISALLAAIPVTIAGGGLWHLIEPSSNGSDLPNMIAAPILILLIAHFVSVALRSRSAWLLLDVVALVASIAFGWRLLLRFTPYWGLEPVHFGIVMAVLGLFLVIAGWAGIERGRVDTVVVHRSTSITFWSLIGATLVSIALWVAWVFSATPADFDWSRFIAHETDGNGEWVLISSGDPNGRGGIPHEFLISTTSGKWMRVDTWGKVAVSADGRVGAVASRRLRWDFSKGLETTMQIIDLTEASPRPRDLGISFNEAIWSAPALSKDGSSLAVVGSKTISVFKLPDEKLLASFPYEGKRFGYVSFEDDGTLLAVATMQASMVVSRFDVTRRSAVSRVEVPGANYVLGARAGRIVTSTSFETAARGRTLQAFDATTGTPLGGPIPDSPAAFSWRVAWLSDGGLAVADMRAAEPCVTIRSDDGTERFRVPLPDAKRINVVGEQRPGELVVSWSGGDTPAWTWDGSQRVGAIDLATGALRVIASDCWPRAYSPLRTPGVGSAGTRLFSTRDGRAVTLDAMTGKMKTLLGKK